MARKRSKQNGPMDLGLPLGFLADVHPKDFPGLPRDVIRDIFGPPKRPIRTPRTGARDKAAQPGPGLLDLQQEFVIGEQRFRRIRDLVFPTRIGGIFRLLVWETSCPTCSALFTVLTGTSRLHGI